MEFRNVSMPHHGHVSSPYLRRISVLALLILGLFTSGWSQGQISGVVQDQGTGSPLVGARIWIENTQIGNLTADDGSFSLKNPKSFPVFLLVTYYGYDTLRTEVSAPTENLTVGMTPSEMSLETVEIIGSGFSDRKKQSALSVESMSIGAIKETPAANFYDGLGSLKEVDLNAASIGFKVVNTRGFNSAAPVRSLQIIDGVDNQAPGLNFSLGNFLGASELDVEQVDLIIGASSAYYGPNAFNGVISMKTKSPFVHKGLSAMVKGGERSLGEFAVRYARPFQNKAGRDVFAFKINAYYLRADDWEATNLDPVDDSRVPIDNPGGYNAVNRYGDENGDNQRYNGTSNTDKFLNPGLGRFYRTGYEERDLVDYDTRNLKIAGALHFMLTPKVELIASSTYGNGTTVLQGDNRYSLKDIQFFQNRLEIRQENKFFWRAYATNEDAGNSYDAVFTAYRLQDRVKSDEQWATDYRNFWAGAVGQDYPFPPSSAPRNQVRMLEGFPPIAFPYDFDTADSVIRANNAFITTLHDSARLYADNFQFPRLVPGTDEFQEAFDEITSTPLNRGGTMLVDRSALYHTHGEYIFNPTWAKIIVGANGRIYRPNSEGTIFSDTLTYTFDTLPDGTVQRVDSSFERISVWEAGIYGGIERTFFTNRLKINATARLDKNQNFNPVPSFAVSGVFNLNSDNILRLSYASAVRNPTLNDQYLYYDVGTAILAGNLDGFPNLVDTASLIRFLEDPDKDKSQLEYFDVDPVQPERVQTFEVGYRGTFKERFYVDAAYYLSRYRDFIGFQVGADIEFSPVFPDILTQVQAFRVSANAQDIVYTQGASVGLNYYLDGGFAINGNYSWNKLLTSTDDPIIPAYNTPEHKFNIGVSGRDFSIGSVKHVGFNVNYKWIDGFLFEGSPQFTGMIPSYQLVDAQVNKFFPKLKSTVKVGASNLFNRRQFQIYGGPRVGRMIYVSLLTEISSI
ncbi:TonB-dependent receptor [Pontibacter sp. G13]|uniref:TonB-dependent receptor n=1 Tax=Pontibacter sp. G13 TaxID=3074898 RepID=UPI0028897DAD|nr:TonB-dependent receptor [Pontibacter sp. G13]WNJ20970.1 TonB-dependent receptor [Pontibacter sp. G13]